MLHHSLQFFKLDVTTLKSGMGLQVDVGEKSNSSQDEHEKTSIFKALLFRTTFDLAGTAETPVITDYASYHEGEDESTSKQYDGKFIASQNFLCFQSKEFESMTQVRSN